MHYRTTRIEAALMATMPFAGLGFAMEAVQSAAGKMTMVSERRNREDVMPPRPVSAKQPSGYTLLVSLGREIRGR